MTMTTDERRTFETLIRLGDTEKQALEAIIERRERADASEAYAAAYYN